MIFLKKIISLKNHVSIYLMLELVKRASTTIEETMTVICESLFSLRHLINFVHILKWKVNSMMVVQ